MSDRTKQTPPEPPQFDFSAYPADTLFLDRRTLPGPGKPAFAPGAAPTLPRPRKERRRRVDPTTFEKQYSEPELEFMNAIQDFKSRSGKMFPSHGDILKVALRLGYRKPMPVEDDGEGASPIVEGSDEIDAAVAAS